MSAAVNSVFAELLHKLCNTRLAEFLDSHKFNSLKVDLHHLLDRIYVIHC